MAPKTIEEHSPARAALERSLTLNKKQSWFGSIRNVVHQGALPAKAAVESLRGGDATNAALSHEASKSPRAGTDTSRSKRNTPGETSARHGSSTSKSAVSSLRLHLSRQSRSSSKRGSVSGIFRTGSNASLRGAHGPEVYYRHSQDLDRTVSPLIDIRSHGKQDANYVPLPSSPINIPSPPVPTLKLDFGPPDSLFPFLGITEFQIADIKALQDPRNITTGVPTSHPCGWTTYKSKSCSFQHDRLDPEAQKPTVDSRKSSIEVEHLGLRPADGVDGGDPFRPGSPMPGTTLHLEMDDAKNENSSQIVPNSIVDRSDKVHATLQSKRTSLLFNRDVDVDGNRKDASAADALVLPSPLAANDREEPVLAHLDDDAGHLDNAEPCISRTNGAPAHPKAPIATLAANPVILHLDTAENQAAKPFLGTLGIQPAEPWDDRSDGIQSQSHIPQSGQLSDDVLVPEGPQSFASKTGKIEAKPATDSSSVAHRKDSLFDDEDMSNRIPNHGLPSPTRAVQLPLRLKTALAKHNSHDSTRFKLTFDRLNAKKPSIFRPGSDPTLRQEYFPQVTEESAALVQYRRQSSLDSNGTKTSQESNSSEESISPDVSGIFERAVEHPSPLHIRKQVGSMPTARPTSPHTPREATSPRTPGSDPFRTPPMGDRQLFDSQRADRNARYNAIHSGSYDAVVDDDSDLHLADFDNAGPGSRETTPRRNSSERELNTVGSPSRPGKAVSAWPPAQAAHGPRRGALLALSRD